MLLIHNSRDSFYRNPIGAAPAGSRVRLRLTVKHEVQPDFVRVRTFSVTESWHDMMPIGQLSGAFLYEVNLTMPEKPNWFWYDFRVCVNDCEISYGNAQDKLGGEGQVWASLPPSYQITVYDKNFTTPEWMPNAIVYQILPDRFARTNHVTVLKGRVLHENWNDAPAISSNIKKQYYCSNDYFGGTLKGIEEKLPYLKELGINALYLNPIFFADTNHRYDTHDYHMIDPMLGNLEDFNSLCSKAMAMGMRVILDGVFSHTGVDSKYFVSAMTNPDSPYRNWFKFDDSEIGYSCWWGDPLLPETIEENEDFVDYTLTGKDATIPYWINNGASGWRLDVADELPMPFLRVLRSAAKKADAQACVIGEVWENASCKVTYGEARGYCFGDTLDSVMNYPLRAAMISFLIGAWDSRRTCREILHLYETYPKQFAYSLMNLMGSHDRPRILNALAEVTGEGLTRIEQSKLKIPQTRRDLARQRMKLFFALLCAIPGMPTIYYGDEAGLEGTYDPFCRGTFPWGNEDNDLREFFRGCIQVRRENAVLRTGEFDMLFPTPNVILVIRWIRGGYDALGNEASDSVALCAINGGSSHVSIVLPESALFCDTLIPHGEGEPLTPVDGLYTFCIDAMGYMIWVNR
ncbi:MAG: glycoside hydrolase family 13 protein [Oscillospiraceae bacterium]|nr:glycoside hydrolase family 13 protein [Oscillospiraceae bacterium]